MNRHPDIDGRMGLFDAEGCRKYLCASERRRFLAAAATADLTTRLFCQLLAITGCRLSEALALTPKRLDPETGRVIFRTLKRRRRIFRAVPVPPDLMRALQLMAAAKEPDAPLWGWCRQTGWRHVTAVMARAGIAGPQASPKGLRHAFGVANAENNIPASLTQRWLGHARAETTAIYQQAVGGEERAFAERLWRFGRSIAGG
ncbi:MAG: site-specific integrase [Caulobacter sp.]|nr:site-specific integrase [Caulobacter sp.]